MHLNTNAWNRVRYTLYAPFYDAVAKLLDRGRQRSLAWLNLQPGEQVLIVGAGTGLDFAYLPLGVRLTAGDLAPAMVQRARDRARRLGLDADIRVLDAHALPFPDCTFDAVVLHLILAVVPDPYAAIEEAARVVKPEGRIGIFDKFLPMDTAPSVLRRMLGAVANVVATDLNRPLEPLLDHAGLHVVRAEPSLLNGLFRVVLAQPAAAPRRLAYPVQS